MMKTFYKDPPVADVHGQLSIQQAHSILHEMETCSKPDSIYGQSVSGILLPSKTIPSNVIDAVTTIQ